MFATEYPALVRQAGSEKTGKFILRESKDGHALTLCVEGESYTAISRYNFFDALCELRKSLMDEGITPLCKGASMYVWPSGMQGDRGMGLRAYKVEPGDSRGTLVDVFEIDTMIEVVHPDEQKAIRLNLMGVKPNK